MSLEPLDKDNFSPEEAKALAAWDVPSPPADLASRIMARHGQRRRIRRALVAVAAVVLAATSALFWLMPHKPQQGEQRLSQRTTLAVADRAVLVAEADSHLRWQVDSDGSATVEQKLGNIFYRVEPGGPFLVKTPKGTVGVLGTCFRVEVEPMKASKAGAVGATLGAAAATLVLVTVYEGRVVSAGTVAGTEVELEAGQSAELRGSQAPRLFGQEGDRSGRKKAHGPKVAGSFAPKAPLALSVRQLQEQNETLAQEKEELALRLAELQTELEASQRMSGKPDILHPTEKELRAMAQRCELAWDNPFHRLEAPELPTAYQEELGMTAEEAQLANRALAEQHQVFLETLRQLYAEVTGDENAAHVLAPPSMIAEITDKSPKAERQAAFQRIARERAGLQAAPADLSQASAIERLMRTLTTVGDRAQQAMAQQVGPDLARRLRERNGGFGSRSRSSSGCPKP